ncbi:DUF433 domain-containing protein [soil metagenome]
MATELLDRIVVNPEIMTGKPVVRGTRIPVALILEKLALDPDIDELLKDYPRLGRDDVRACLAYAQAVISHEDVFPQIAQPTEAAT